MSLWPAADPVTPIITYQDGSGQPLPWFVYNPGLIAPPRHYWESLSSFKNFFYEPSSDRLVAFATMSCIQWPGWEVAGFFWDAGTGAFLGRASSGAINLAWSSQAGLGSYGGIYCRYIVWIIQQVDPLTLSYNGGFTIDMAAWTPNPMFNYALVNQDDKLIIGVQDWFLSVWSYEGTPRQLGQIRIPDGLGYLAYQDRQNCWIITHGGIIAKCNYQKLRWEMLSSVQNPVSDATNYLCAYDTRRSRLVVLRQRPDAADGACQCQLEFYRPLSRMVSLTDPVPVTPLRAGSRMRFAAQLLGDGGEGLAGAYVTAQLASPAHGQVAAPLATARQGGALAFDYVAPEAGADTLQLSTTIQDGHP
jgi:hypothetical protein